MIEDNYEAVATGKMPETAAKTVKDAIGEFLSHKRTFITKRGRCIADGHDLPP